MKRVLAILGLVGGFLAPAQAARLPDWARPIAEQAPAVETAPSTSFDSRVLLSETTLVVLPDGTFRTRRLLARHFVQLKGEVPSEHVHRAGGRRPCACPHRTTELQRNLSYVARTDWRVD